MDQDPPIFTMSLHGDDVHYVKAGGGPVVVLIHGILGSRRRVLLTFLWAVRSLGRCSRGRSWR
jgi:pimeloyl-ACP methyl ester carboxylesterase